MKKLLIDVLYTKKLLSTKSNQQREHTTIKPKRHRKAQPTTRLHHNLCIVLCVIYCVNKLKKKKDCITNNLKPNTHTHKNKPKKPQPTNNNVNLKTQKTQTNKRTHTVKAKAPEWNVIMLYFVRQVQHSIKQEHEE